MRIAAAQLDAALGLRRVRDGAAAADAIARAATEHAADVVLLPEYSSGWASPLTPDLVTSEDGPFLAAVRAAAARHGVTVVVGVVLPGPDAGDGAVRARNVTVVVGPDGVELGRYTKAHLYDAYGSRESDLLDAGEPAGDGAPLTVLVPTASGPARLGVLTCYDLRFPEPFRALMDDGDSRPDVVVLGAAWAAGEGKAEQLRVLARARAIENTVYVAIASQPGDGRTGGSVVVDPAGGVLDEADASGVPDGPTFAVADVDPARLAAVRESSPVLTHRRYGVHPLGTDAD